MSKYKLPQQELEPNVYDLATEFFKVEIRRIHGLPANMMLPKSITDIYDALCAKQVLTALLKRIERG